MKTIGIVMRIEKLDGQYKWFLNESYVLALQRYPLSIFPICSYPSLVQAASVCDGLIIPGGYDIHAYYLHTATHAKDHYYDKQMDAFDFLCIEAFITAKKPILGICRGMQVINVYFQGTLLQDIDTTLHAPHHLHDILIQDASILQQVYKEDPQVNSYHHQSVDCLGKGFLISATTKQGHIEAIEHPEKRILAVQWHPELMENDQIIPYFFSLL